MHITGPQIAAARTLLRISAQTVADAASVGLATVRRAEASESVPKITAANLNAIRRALEEAGVEFIPENGGGAGVRLRKKEKIQ